MGDGWNRNKVSGLNLARKRLIKWCVGNGVDLGCSDLKIKKDVIGVDEHDHSRVDTVADVFSKLPFEDNYFDYVFSSHCLTSAKPNDVPDILNEWLRILKNKHLLILYLHDRDFYYHLEHQKGSKGIKKDYRWQDIWNILKNKNTQLIHHSRNGRYDSKGNPININDWQSDRPTVNYGEWSFTIVVKKLCKE